MGSARTPRGLEREPGSQKNSEEASFQQQNIPLEGEEILAHRYQREVAQPSQSESRTRRDTQHHQQSQECSEAAEQFERPVTRADPGQRREQTVGLGTKIALHSLQEIVHRKNSVCANQTNYLHPQREKGDRINQAK